MSFNFKNFNLSKIVKIANSISNPKQGINTLLDEMGKKNPQQANMLRNMINSGKSPQAAIKQFASSGDVTLEQLNDLKQGYAILGKLGLKHKVPASVWKEAEDAIKSGASSNSKSSKFTGF